MIILIMLFSIVVQFGGMIQVFYDKLVFDNIGFDVVNKVVDVIVCLILIGMFDMQVFVGWFKIMVLNGVFEFVVDQFNFCWCLVFNIGQKVVVQVIIDVVQNLFEGGLVIIGMVVGTQFSGT